MNRFNEKILRWNFKKIFRVYIIALITAAIMCAAAVGVVYRGRISFATQYSAVREAMEEGNTAGLQARIDSLAASSDDVTDILVLDSRNNVTYSAKNSRFAVKQFNLTKTPGGDSNYFMLDGNAGTAFRYVKSDEFMLSSVFNTDFGSIREEYRDEKFFESGYSSDTVYLLSFIGSRDGGSKIYVISSPTSVPGGALTMKAVAAAAVLIFMCGWVLVALWVYQNALRSRLYAVLWGLIALLTNLAGLIVYLLYKRGNVTCPACGASQSRLHVYCTGCGAKLGRTCPSCGAQIGRRDAYCHGCGAKAD